MTLFPFSFGPADDWDPQGYGNEEEELEDELVRVGMSVKTEDEEGKTLETGAVKALDGDGEKPKEDDDEVYEDAALDPLVALDVLADQINQTERETLRFKDFDE